MKIKSSHFKKWGKIITALRQPRRKPSVKKNISRKTKQKKKKQALSSASGKAQNIMQAFYLQQDSATIYLCCSDEQMLDAVLQAKSSQITVN